MSSSAELRDAILRVVRGEASHSILRDSVLAFKVELGADGWYRAFESGSSVDVTVEPEDVLAGFRRYLLAGDERALRAWAFALQAGSFWSFDPLLDDTVIVDIIKDALWDASFGNTIKDEALALICGSGA
jgi:hypothetical protein